MKWWILTLLNVVLFGGAVVLYAAAWAKYSERNACLKVTSTYCQYLPYNTLSYLKTNDV